jgi:pimeloyl-ACP methyl ester carboxylesterase
VRRFAATLLLALPLFASPAVHADPWNSSACPPEPPREFPAGFNLPIDQQAVDCAGASNAWADPHVGGWGGGDCPAGHIPRTPVVFLHGNGGDAWHWNLDTDSPDGSTVNVRQRFLDAGYCAKELWAVSYSGAVTPEGEIGGGYGTYDDVNAPEVYRFMLAVRDFVGTPQIDVVGHSLGVTVARKAMFLHRHDALSPYVLVRRAVMIAGANQGTTTCRGEQQLDVCKEVQPGSAWLAELNAPGESPGPTRWLTVCDCTGVADDFYLGPDAESPLLKGAAALRFPYMNHFQLGLSETAIAGYLPFLIEGSTAAAALPRATSTSGSSAPAPARPAVQPARPLPATGIGDGLSPGVALLLLAFGAALIDRMVRS